MTAEDERDTEGRHPGAPAWAGDLATASAAALEAHGKGLRLYIAALTAKYEGHRPAGQQWRPATATELRDARLSDWVARLVDVENARSRRDAEEAGEWLRSQPGYRPGMKQMTATHTDDDVAVAAIVARRLAGPYEGA